MKARGRSIPQRLVVGQRVTARVGVGVEGNDESWLETVRDLGRVVGVTREARDRKGAPQDVLGQGAEGCVTPDGDGGGGGFAV
jgi:hypothetical protein